MGLIKSLNPFLPRSSRIRHQNVKLPVVYMEDIKGGKRIVNTTLEMYTLAEEMIGIDPDVVGFENYTTEVYVIATGRFHLLINVDDVTDDKFNSTAFTLLPSTVALDEDLQVLTTPTEDGKFITPTGLYNWWIWKLTGSMRFANPVESFPATRITSQGIVCDVNETQYLYIGAQLVRWVYGDNSGDLVVGTLTADRSWALQDKSGTVALTNQDIDIEITDSTKGFITKDRGDSTRRRIVSTNGILTTEIVS